MFPWSSARTLVPLTVGLAGLVAFVVYETCCFRNPPATTTITTRTTSPLIPLSIFANRTAIASYTGTLLHGLILWSLLYYLPLYYLAVRGYPATLTGVALFPETFTIAPISVAVGLAVSKTGRYRWSIWSGWCLTILGMSLLSQRMDAHTTTIGDFVGENLVVGVGLGLLFASMNLAGQAAASERHVGFAAGMYVFARSMGQAVGVAVGGVVFQTSFAGRLREVGSGGLAGVGPGSGNATALAQDASALVQAIQSLPAGSAQRQGIVAAYAEALEVVWAVMAGVAGVAFLVSLLTKGLSLDAVMETEQALREGTDGGGGRRGPAAATV